MTGQRSKSCRRLSYLLFVAVVALSPQVVRAVLFDPDCDPSDFDCRHEQDPEQDDVEGEDNIFIHSSLAPTTISVPPATSPAPNATPSPTVTAAPTITPSPTRTTIPTSSATATVLPAVTVTPTSSPSPTRTSAPSLPSCNLDDSGFYGDGNQTASQPVEIKFNYQVQVTPGATFVTVQNDVLPSVENSIVENLLPSIFPCSGTSERRRGLRLLQSSLTGISTQPSDLILSGVPCGGIAIDCFVIDAKMTLFGEDAVDFLGPTGDLIDDAMSSGEFDEGVDARIVSVRFLNETSIDRLVGESNNGQDGGIASTTKDLPGWGIALIVIGSLLFAGLLSSCPLPCGKDDDDSTLKTEKKQRQTRRVMEDANEEGGLMAIPESTSSFSM